MLQSVPERIGRHEIVALLGEGGMARVYLAVSRGPAGVNKLAVIKLIRAELAWDNYFVTMFLDEARLAARLNHPNVVQTYDVLKDGENYVLVMEYLEGQPLSAIFGRVPRRSFPLEEHLWVLTQVLGGLQYAHSLSDYDGSSLGVVHRDVSPANVFVTYHGDVKLLDFGIAKARDAAATTKSGTLKGKIGYCAPEQIQGDGVPDARADIFAVGVLLWEALAGRRLRMGTPAETAQARIAGKEPKIREVRSDVDPALADICDRAMALDPAGRYATAAEFQRDIEAYLAKATKRVGRAQLAQLVQGHFEVERQVMSKRVEEQLVVAQSSQSIVRDVQDAQDAQDTRDTQDTKEDAEVITDRAPVVTAALASLAAAAGDTDSSLQSKSSPILKPARPALPAPNSTRSPTPLPVPSQAASPDRSPGPSIVPPRVPSSPGGAVPSRRVPTGEIITRRVITPPDADSLLGVGKTLPVATAGAVAPGAVSQGRPKRASTRQWLVIAVLVVGLGAGAVFAWTGWVGWKGSRDLSEAAGSAAVAPTGVANAVTPSPSPNKVVVNALTGGTPSLQPSSNMPAPPVPSSPSLGEPAPVETIQLRLRIEPKDVSLTLDGHAIRGNQLRAVVPKDKSMHVVQAEAPGYVPLNQIVSFASDVDLDIELRRLRPVAKSRSQVEARSKPQVEAKSKPPQVETRPRLEPSRTEEPGMNIERPPLRRTPRLIDERDPYTP